MHLQSNLSHCDSIVHLRLTLLNMGVLGWSMFVLRFCDLLRAPYGS